jgi:hypothetical protein
MLADELGGDENRALHWRESFAFRCRRKNYQRELHRRFAMNAMTPEELNESLAQRERPNGRPPMPARDANLLGAVGEVLVAELDPLRKRLEALERKLAELEFKQGQFRYCGTWSADQVYFEGNFTTEGGSLWHAHRQTTQKPGDGSDWTLCVKRGKDGVDVRRPPTAQRALGDVSQR